MELAKKKLVVSRRRIGQIMNEEGLVSSYTVAQYKPHMDKSNESRVENVVSRSLSGPATISCSCKRFDVCESWNKLALHMCTCRPL